MEAGPLRVSDLLTYLLVNCVLLCILQSVVNAQKTSVPGSMIAVNGATERVCDLRLVLELELRSAELQLSLI